MSGLCADLILGLDFQSQHSSGTFHYGGSEPPLAVCGFSKLNIDPLEPFVNLTADCHPIASKSQRYSQEDSAFIDEEVKRSLKEGIIEPSLSPWRAQVVVTKDEDHKKRLAIDYSQTIIRFTLLDAFLLPRISDMVNKIAQYRASALLIFEVHIIKCRSRMKTSLTQPLKLEAISISSPAYPSGSPMELRVFRER